MIAGGIRTFAVSALIIALLAFCSCSKAKDTQKEGKDTKSATQQATESIRDFGKKPIDKARAAQKLGDDRTKAIDEAVGGLNRFK
jgi:outer membrane biogenesis lipoprotein LolB